MNAPHRPLLFCAVLTALSCVDPDASSVGTDPSFHRGRDDDHQPTVIVDPSGRHGRPTTIQAGIDAVVARGTVLILPGTYAEVVQITKAVTIAGLGHARPIIAPPDAPPIAVQVTTPDRVTIRNVEVRFGGLNGIRGDGAVDLHVEHVTVTAVNPPAGRGYMVSAVNDPGVGGARARLHVLQSALDGTVDNFAPGTPGMPQMFGVVAQGDVDARFEKNQVRRTGGACMLVLTRADGAGVTNATLQENDLDLCHPTGRVASLIVGAPATLPTTQLTVTGEINLIGNVISNSSQSCLPTNAIVYEFGTGVIEHNRIVDFAQACATPSNRSLPGGIWIGSTRTIGGVALPPAAPAVRYNDIAGNAQAGLRIGPNQPAMLDARCNYWGAENGPSGTGLSGSGDALVIQAAAAVPDVTPFATDPVTDGPGHRRGASCRLDYSLWSAPVHLGDVVNSSVADIQPALSPNGLSLYFSSARAGGLGANDIWVSQRACDDCPWGTPVNVAALNSTALDGGPTFSRDGRIMFFHSGRPGGPGNNDIFVARRADPADDFGWEPPVVLGEGVNTAALENKPFFLATGWDGAGLLYFNRGPNANELNDLFVARVTRAGEVLSPAEPIAELNDPVTNEQGAHLRADGREMILQSNRAGTVGLADLYVSTRRHVWEPWSAPENLGIPINSTARDAHAYLSRDATVMLFSSDRSGTLGERDIWMTTRVRLGHHHR